MAKFTVRKRVDAYAIYLAEVEAPDAISAATLARDNEEKFKWEEDTFVEFDARNFVTLTENGEEEQSAVGDRI